jgi:hypothetical protein
MHFWSGRHKPEVWKGAVGGLVASCATAKSAEIITKSSLGGCAEVRKQKLAR